MKRTPSTAGPPLKRYGNARNELRAWMDQEGYQRLLREAAARNVSASRCVRECLWEYFSLKDTMALPPEVEANDRSGHRAGRRPASLLEAVELAITGALRQSQEQHHALLEKFRHLACMLDQAYQGIVVRLVQPDSATRDARIAYADESARRWRRAVAALHRDGGPRLVQQDHEARREGPVGPPPDSES